MSTIRIGNAAGFWGDSLAAPRRLVEAAGLHGFDYLTLEYLAELTMSILAHLKSRDAEAGFVTDFPTVVRDLVSGTTALEGRPTRIVTNAGGMNPDACCRAVSRILAEHGLANRTVAAVGGDDLFPRFDELLAAGEEFRNFETGEPLGELRLRMVCANAYLGAAGIVEALRAGAEIVVTGRVADASLTVGPAIHEFGWQFDDWRRLAAATVAGHLIECGAQVTGGMYSDWTPAMPLDDVGYPIAEISEPGATVITKPPGTGGAVTVGTVSEQLIYEIGDPAHYLTPDVDADFTHVTLVEEGPDRIRVAGAAGNPAPERYKVSLAYRDGYMVSGTLVVAGPNAVEKAGACGEIIRRRAQRAGCEPQRMHVELLGAGDVVPGAPPWRTLPASEPKLAASATSGGDPPEIVLRVAAHDPSKEKLERFQREFAPLVTSGPPGVTGYTGPRQKPYPVLAYWPTMIARDRVAAQVIVKTAKEWTA
jgi:Acyclic terpene utilisation family protein AtuA